MAGVATIPVKRVSSITLGLSQVLEITSDNQTVIYLAWGQNCLGII